MRTNRRSPKQGKALEADILLQSMRPRLLCLGLTHLTYRLWVLPWCLDLLAGPEGVRCPGVCFPLIVFSRLILLLVIRLTWYGCSSFVLQSSRLTSPDAASASDYTGPHANHDVAPIVSSSVGLATSSTVPLATSAVGDRPGELKWKTRMLSFDIGRSLWGSSDVANPYMFDCLTLSTMVGCTHLQKVCKSTYNFLYFCTIVYNVYFLHINF